MPDRKIIKLDMAIEPWAEISKVPVRSWIKLSDKLKKEITEIPVKRSMDLDARKWKLPVLVNGVKAVSRYELKTFATTAVKLHQEVSKNKKDQSKAEDELVKAYKSIRKQIEDKVSLALDEVEADKGESKKSLKDGKDAFSSASKPKNFAGVFFTASTSGQGAVQGLSRALRLIETAETKAEDAYQAEKKRIESEKPSSKEEADVASHEVKKEAAKRKLKDKQKKQRQLWEKKRDEAFGAAAGKLDKVRKAYDDDRKAIEQWIDKVTKYVGGMKGADLPPEFEAFRTHASKTYKKELANLKTYLATYDKKLDGLANDVKSLKGRAGETGREAKDIDRKIKDIELVSAWSKSAHVAAGAFDDLKGRIKDLEKQFK